MVDRVLVDPLFGASRYNRLALITLSSTTIRAVSRSGVPSAGTDTPTTAELLSMVLISTEGDSLITHLGNHITLRRRLGVPRRRPPPPMRPQGNGQCGQRRHKNHFFHNNLSVPSGRSPR